MKFYPKLHEHGNVTRPIPEPVRQWAEYNEIGQYVGRLSATTAQANAIREQYPEWTLEPINPTTPHER